MPKWHSRLVCLVALVYLVGLVQPNKQDRPDSPLTRQTNLESYSNIHDRPYQLEGQGSSWLERRQREACRFLGKPGAWNHGDREIQKALLQRLPQCHAPLSRKRSIDAVPLQLRQITGCIAAGECALDKAKRERGNRNGAGRDPFEHEILDLDLHAPFPCEGIMGALCIIPPMHKISLDCPSADVGFQENRKVYLLEMAVDGNWTL